MADHNRPQEELTRDVWGLLVACNAQGRVVDEPAPAAPASPSATWRAVARRGRKSIGERERDVLAELGLARFKRVRAVAGTSPAVTHAGTPAGPPRASPSTSPAGLLLEPRAAPRVRSGDHTGGGGSAAASARDPALEAKILQTLKESSTLWSSCFNSAPKRPQARNGADPTPNRPVRAEFQLEDFDRTLQEGGDKISVNKLVTRKINMLRKSCQAGGDVFEAFSEAAERTAQERQEAIRQRLVEGTNYVRKNCRAAKGTQLKTPLPGRNAGRPYPLPPPTPDHLARARRVREEHHAAYEAKGAPYWNRERDLAEQAEQEALQARWLQVCVTALAHAKLAETLAVAQAPLQSTFGDILGHVVPSGDGDDEEGEGIPHNVASQTVKARHILLSFFVRAVAKFRARRRQRATNAIYGCLYLQRRRIRFLRAGRCLVESVIKLQRFVRGLRNHRAACVHMMHRQWLMYEAQLIEEDYKLTAVLLEPHNPATAQHYEPYRHPRVCEDPFHVRPADVLTADLIPTIVPSGFTPFTARHSQIWRVFLEVQREQVKRYKTYFREAAARRSEINVYQSLVESGGANFVEPPSMPNKPRMKLVRSKESFMELVKQTHMQHCTTYASLLERKRRIKEQERAKLRMLMPMFDAKACGVTLLEYGRSRLKERKTKEHDLNRQAYLSRRQMQKTEKRHGITTQAAFNRFVAVDKETYKSTMRGERGPSCGRADVKRQVVDHKLKSFAKGDEGAEAGKEVEHVARDRGVNFPELAMTVKTTAEGVMLFPPPSPPRLAVSRLRDPTLRAQAQRTAPRPPSAGVARTARPPSQPQLAATLPARSPATARSVASDTPRSHTQGGGGPRLNAILKSAINVSKKHPVQVG